MLKVVDIKIEIIERPPKISKKDVHTEVNKNFKEEI